MHKVNGEQKNWVEATLAGLSVEERIAQLLLPSCGDEAGVQALLDLMPSVPIGGVFVVGADMDTHRSRLERLQSRSRVPLVIAADLEAGAGNVVQGATTFPDLLALAAVDDELLAYSMGKAAALQGRAAGIHWTFAPVVDINRNPDNPITNTRSLGDDPERIIRLAGALVRGMQDHGLAACPKHFPGDGMDDIDQHIATSVNPLSIEEWLRLSGRVFKMMYNDAGAWSTMIGHIAFPAWDPARDERGAFCPGTVNRKIVTELLRDHLGFQGLIVTDDMNMGGVAGYMNRRGRIAACVAAGCDMVLFPRLPEDFHTLMQALEDGLLSQRRIDEAARRVLAFKARLQLNRELFGPEPDRRDVDKFRSASREIAERAIHLVRDVHDQLPVRDLKPGARVLTVTLSNEGVDLPIVNEELKARGFQVDHLLNPENWTFAELAREYDAVFLNFTHKAGWAIGSVRSVGVQNRMFMHGFFMEHPRAIITSFGSPYHLRTFSTFPNYINVHSAGPESQRAAVAAWFGEIAMRDDGPVQNLVRDHQIDEAELIV